MKQLFTLFFLCCGFLAFSQEEATKEPNKYDINYPMASVTNPSYEQGLIKLRKDIVNNVEIDKSAKMAQAGVIATVSMRIDPKGKPTDIHVIKPIGYGIDKQIVDQLKNKQFTPIKQDGIATSCAVVVEIPVKK